MTKVVILSHALLLDPYLSIKIVPLSATLISCIQMKEIYVMDPNPWLQLYM